MGMSKRTRRAASNDSSQEEKRRVKSEDVQPVVGRKRGVQFYLLSERENKEVRSHERKTGGEERLKGAEKK